jgi:RNA polymerase sigma factor (sigma-70 family)
MNPRSISAPLSAWTDDELVASVRSGHDAAFAEIYRRYHQPLRSFAARLLHAARDDADDVVQEAFIRARRGLLATDGPMALRAWLYMIVRNCALDTLRAQRRTHALDDEMTISAVGAPDPAQSLAQRCELRELLTAIGDLPDRQRHALVLREFDGRSHVETARLLHTTVAATKSLIIRARTNLDAARRAA